MTNHQDEDLTALDVIRCVYLARTAEQRGDCAAARRWQAKVDAWLHGTYSREGRSFTESKPRPP